MFWHPASFKTVATCINVTHKRTQHIDNDITVIYCNTSTVQWIL